MSSTRFLMFSISDKVFSVRFLISSKPVIVPKVVIVSIVAIASNAVIVSNVSFLSVSNPVVMFVSF
ncbi:MAG: hypothetical protein WCG95_08465, partial [bacterium]